MDKERMHTLALEARAKMTAMKAFDTLENEKHLISLLTTLQIEVTIRQKKSPERYKLTMPDGSIIWPISLLDLNDMCIKLKLL